MNLPSSDSGEPTRHSLFLSFWDRLAIAKTVPELRDVWRGILERADPIGPRGVNELWEFYCERLGALEAGAGECQDGEEAGTFRKMQESRTERPPLLRPHSCRNDL